MQECLRSNCERPCRSPDTNPIKHLRRDVKMAVHQLSSTLSLRSLCAKNNVNMSKSSSAKLTASYPRTRGCNCCQTCFNGVNGLTHWYYLMLHSTENTMNIIVQTQTIPLTEILHLPSSVPHLPTSQLAPLPHSAALSIHHSSQQLLLSVVAETRKESD